MNLKKWLAGKILSRNVKKIKEISPIEQNIDKILAEEMKGMTQTNRTIDKLLKVKLIRKESQNTIAKLAALDEELNEGEEYEDEDVPDFQERISEMLIKKVLGGAAAAPVPQETGGTEGGELDFGNPAEQAIPQPIEKSGLIDAITNASPAEIDAIKRKFLG